LAQTIQKQTDGSLLYRDGTAVELLGGKYRLVSINDNNNNGLRLAYVDNQPMAI
jgi:hypothetical protein